MSEKPILFSGPMVRAILEGRKTQTRRVFTFRETNQPPACPDMFNLADCKWGSVGQRLWVRETTCIAPKHFAAPDDTCVTDYDGDKRYVSYKADGHSEDAMRDYKLKWTPSIHVPRWACRLVLEIVNVRVERLQDITEEDAKKEGCDGDCPIGYIPAYEKAPLTYHFNQLWESLYPESWNLNPYVWVVEFRKVEDKR